MGLSDFTNDELAQMSLIQLAKLVLLDQKDALSFKDTFDKVAELKGYDDETKKHKIGQFYTDLNMDGTFVTNGSNMWGLRQWYPVTKKSTVKMNSIKPSSIMRNRDYNTLGTDGDEENDDVDVKGLSILDDNLKEMDEDYEQYDEMLDEDFEDEDYDDMDYDEEE